MNPLRRVGRMLLGALLAVAAGALRADTAHATITQPTGAVTVWTGQAVSFSGTTDTDGTFSWAFGDGATGAGAATSHAYASPGTYTAVMTVTVSQQQCAVMNQDGSCSRYRTVTTTYTANRTITVLAPPAISSFTASASSVSTGAPVTLSWATSNATSLSISGVGDVTGTTSTVVHPSGTTTYTLTAINAGGSVSGSVTVTTYTLTIGISPATANLKLGESATFTGTISPAGHGLSWSASGGSLSGSTFTGTAAGTFTVTVSSTEDSTKSATATVTVSPATVATPVSDAPTGQTFVGGVVHFTAQVSGAVDTGVTWSVNGGGTVNASGAFTASTLGTWTVTATSKADPTKQASATIQVVPLVVAVSPGTTTVKSGYQATFTAAVTGPGSPSQSVTWSVVSPGGGTITSAGVYTAPATAGDYTVKATSVQDGTCAGTATVHVPGWTLKLKKDIVYVGAKEVAEVDASGKTWVTFDDHLGSPRFQWDGTASPVDGTNLIRQKFAPFGESLVDTATQSKFAKGFTGHEQTDPSGLTYMQARFYAPMYGRFLSPDPARDQHFEDTQSWNIYSYTRNSPTMQVDPTGMAVGLPVDNGPSSSAKCHPRVSFPDIDGDDFLVNEPTDPSTLPDPQGQGDQSNSDAWTDDGGRIPYILPLQPFTQTTSKPEAEAKEGAAKATNVPDDPSVAKMVTSTSESYTKTIYATLKEVGVAFSLELTRLQDAKLITTDGEYGSMVKQVEGGFQLGPMCRLGHIGINGNSDQYGFHPDAVKGGPWYAVAHRHPTGGSVVPSGTDIAGASTYQKDGRPHGSILVTPNGHGMVFRPTRVFDIHLLNRMPRELLPQTYFTDASW